MKQPLAATTREGELVRHVGNGKHALVAGTAVRIDADVTAVAGAVAVIASAALMDDNVRENG